MARFFKSRSWRIVLTLVLTTSLTIGLSAGPASASISNHQVTNVTDKSFTVTWISDAAETGQVKWGTTALEWDANTTDDERGASTSDDTHHVRITGLTAGGTYYYKIVSGEVTSDVWT